MRLLPFHVDTVLLRRLYVLVFIHHDAQLVRIAGVTAKPAADWMTQQARSLSMELGEQAQAVKFLIHGEVDSWLNVPTTVTHALCPPFSPAC